MLEGLEVSVLKLSEVIKFNDRFRFDAEFFKKEYLNIENKLKEHNFKRLIDIDSKIIHPSEIKREYVESDGVWFFRTQNIRPLKIEESNNVFISKEDAKSLAKNLIKKGDVMITRTGANFGQTALYNVNKIAIGSSHTFILRNEYFKQAYLAVFLNTIFGRKLIDKGMYGGSQPEIAPYYLNNIPIPDFSITFQQIIENVLKLSEVSIEESQTQYKETQTILLQELGITETLLQTKGLAINNKSFKDSFADSGRLDAEYYQPKYEAIMQVARFGGMEAACLDAFVNIKKSIEPGSDAYQETGIPFLRVSNISKLELTEPDIYLDETLYGIEALYPKKDTILLTKDGSVGLAYKVEHDMKAITSSALLHLEVINTNVILPDYLTLVLNSPVVQMQAERDCGGSIIQHWRIDEVRKVMIPLLDMPTQQQIASLIQQSFQLRKQSKHLLDIAKQAVEMAIETDEATAMAFIQANTN